MVVPPAGHDPGRIRGRDALERMIDVEGTFRIRIDLGNEGCSSPEEVAKLLRVAAERVDVFGAACPPRLLDENGNTVGMMELVPPAR